MPRGFRFYPLLFAAAPILHLQANNSSLSTLGDLLLVVAIAMAAFAVFQVVALVLLRRVGRAELAPPLTLVAAVWFFGFRPVADRLEAGGLERAPLSLFALGLVASAALLYRLGRRPARVEPAGRFFLLTGGLLAAFNAADIARDHILSAKLVGESRVLRQLERPVPGPSDVPGPRRDIYVIIVDQYAGSDILREQFEFDNRPFEDSLRALGFHVPGAVRSNYVHTVLSVPSLLNAAHMTPLEPEVQGVSDPTLVNELIAWSRVADFLTRRGYRYVFFPSKWWHPTRRTRQASVEPRVWTGFDPIRDIGRTELRRVALRTTLVPGRLVNRLTLKWDADHVRRTMIGIAQARRFGRPVFVVAHLISPHPPYSVDGSCRPSLRPTSYPDQVECLNRQLLGLANRLIRSSQAPPVIIIQGDHGSRKLGFHEWDDAGQVPPEAVRERLSTFGAYYLPAGGAAAFGDTVTVVNVLGNVLRHYFGARLPREPDELYMSQPGDPFDFHRVGQDWRVREELVASGAGR